MFPMKRWERSAIHSSRRPLSRDEPSPPEEAPMAVSSSIDHDSMLSQRFFSMSSASDGHGFLPDVDGDDANNRLDENGSAGRRGVDDAPPWLASPAGRGCRKQESMGEGYQDSHSDDQQQHLIPAAGTRQPRRRRSDTTPEQSRATSIACRTYRGCSRAI